MNLQFLETTCFECQEMILITCEDAKNSKQVECPKGHKVRADQVIAPIVIIAIEKKDQGIFDEWLCRVFHERMFRSARCRNKPEVAREVVMEVLSDLWERRSPLPEWLKLKPDKLESYLIKATKYKGISKIRSIARKPSENLNENQDIEAVSPDRYGTYDLLVRRIDLDKGKKYLRQEEIELIELYIEGLSYEEISKTMDLPIEMIRKKLYLVRQKLKRKLA